MKRIPLSFPFQPDSPPTPCWYGVPTLCVSFSDNPASLCKVCSESPMPVVCVENAYRVEGEDGFCNQFVLRRARNLYLNTNDIREITYTLLVYMYGYSGHM